MPVSASFEIIGCEVVPSQDANKNAIKLVAKPTVTVTESLLPDPASTYTIDIEALNTLTKVTKAEFNMLESGLITGLNAAMSDQTGAIAIDATKAVGSTLQAIVLPEVSIPKAFLSRATTVIAPWSTPPSGTSWTLSGRS